MLNVWLDYEKNNLRVHKKSLVKVALAGVVVKEGE